MNSNDTTASVAVVAYNNSHIDLRWVHSSAEIIVVHNDDVPVDVQATAPIRHIHSGGNVGFGAAVNAAARATSATRLIMANPDLELTAEHLELLTTADPDTVVTVPLVDRAGAPTSVVNRYPSALVLLLSGYRVGRFVKRGSFVRRASRHLGGWFSAHDGATASAFSRGPLAQYWASGAVLSIDRDRFLAVDGFDPAYFLYFEDVDLQQHLATRFPTMALEQRGDAGVHTVSASTKSSNASVVALHHCRSAERYARTRVGLAFRVAATALRPRLSWLEHRVGRR